jgi:Carboxypeptidase regulatory-like domain
VYEGNDSGRATFEWKEGQKYLLFLFYSAVDKSWALDGCGNSEEFGGAKSVLEQIDAIQSHTDGGVIHGVVSGHTISTPLAGVRVEARGTNGLYRATTNAKGEFEIKVPAGKYSVHASKTGFSFHTADLSYENPQGLQIEPGGCAQVQLVAR